MFRSRVENRIKRLNDEGRLNWQDKSYTANQ
jgi:hypothetical protein